MKCWIETQALTIIKSESERLTPKETGGILLGYWGLEDVVVTTATGPGPKSKHKSSSYIPDIQFDRDQIAKIYHESGGVITYLGDWHSHPKGGSELSRDDIITLFNIATFELARLATPVMLISVKELCDWTPVVWRNEIERVGGGEYYSHLSPLQIFGFSR
jgi:integrative and conjugative element protein (TIGR02256 family)